jgi:hypothetical protein
MQTSAIRSSHSSEDRPAFYASAFAAAKHLLESDELQIGDFLYREQDNQLYRRADGLKAVEYVGPYTDQAVDAILAKAEPMELKLLSLSRVTGDILRDQDVGALGMHTAAGGAAVATADFCWE